MTLSSCDSSELAPAVAMTTSSSNDSVDDVTSGGLVELRRLLATVSAVSETSVGCVVRSCQRYLGRPLYQSLVSQLCYLSQLSQYKFWKVPFHRVSGARRYNQCIQVAKAMAAISRIALCDVGGSSNCRGTADDGGKTRASAAPPRLITVGKTQHVPRQIAPSV